MSVGHWLILLATVYLAIVGTGFRLGHFRRLSWTYFDPEWSRNRVYRNGPFAYIPGALMFGSGLLLSFVVPSPSLLGDLLFLVLMAALVWLLITLFFRPAKFLKPRWLREQESGGSRG